MFDSINEVETAVLYIICGLFLFLSSMTVFIIFICYRQLRNGIYGMILGTAASEAYFGLHAIFTAVYALSRNHSSPVNSVYCRTEATIAVFFWAFWCTQNMSIMILFIQRKLSHSKLEKGLFFFSLGLSILLAMMLNLNEALGISHSGSCFINKRDQFATLILACLFYFVFLLALVYNLWFLFCRNSSLDRNFINGYNYFILIASFFYLFVTSYLLLIYYFDVDAARITWLYYLALIGTPLGLVYISVFRLQIEHVRIVFSFGPSRWKAVNCLLLFCGCMNKPKFKDIKRVLNVKVVDCSGINDTDDTIYSHIIRNAEI